MKKQGRRLATVRIADHFVSMALRGMLEPGLGETRAFSGLPSDARLVHVAHEAHLQWVAFTFESRRFKPVKRGEIPPLIDICVTSTIDTTRHGA